MPRRKRVAKKYQKIADLYVHRRTKKGLVEKLADQMTMMFGSMLFLTINALFFFAWMFVNSGKVGAFLVLDPFPFNLLTMIVSLEAIFLSIIVLMSQSRASRIAELREEIDFQVNVQAEREITKVLKMLDVIQHRMNVHHHNDKELKDMKRRLNLSTIADQVEQGRG